MREEQSPRARASFQLVRRLNEFTAFLFVGYLPGAAWVGAGADGAAAGGGGVEAA